MITNEQAARALKRLNVAKRFSANYSFGVLASLLSVDRPVLESWIASRLFPAGVPRRVRSAYAEEPVDLDMWAASDIHEWLTLKLKPLTDASPDFGAAPVMLGTVELDPTEMCFVQYMPIAMPGVNEIRIPKGLQWVQPLLDRIDFTPGHEYMYLTAKHMFVTPTNMGNRGGWHTDGFGTIDLNYAWADKAPTEFCVQPFNITPDDARSLYEMEVQADSTNIKTYDENSLLLIDQHVVHRVPVSDFAGLRTFVRFSLSPDKYNMCGNAHNPLFDYDWPMQKRASDRNNTAYKA